MTESLGEALPAKMKFIREEVIPAYQSIGPAGNLAIAMMNQSLTIAEKALAEGDLVQMMRSYEDLKDYKL
ncbi:hypothetical protein MXMO3_01694 [Maritalea myrionectae]|uniref:Uncharacterized protein n=1 Tax=Maritalea myrionectae TaxID=454601 RepID=A0A2R4MDY2_9HYPH|nr:hypothetical protein [Maritalea myrionectae]AVX04220.1 hypothetical protein MXMO3_01694 [Maritalea myrionectae]